MASKVAVILGFTGVSACARAQVEPPPSSPPPAATSSSDPDESGESVTYPYRIALRARMSDAGRWGPVGYVQVEPSRQVTVGQIDTSVVQRVQACLDRLNAEKMLSYTVPPPEGMDGSYGEFVNRESPTWAFGVEDSIGELCGEQEVQVDVILQRFERRLPVLSGLDVAYVIAARLYAARTEYPGLMTLDPDGAIATSGPDAHTLTFEGDAVSVQLTVTKTEPAQTMPIHERVGDFWVVGEVAPATLRERVVAAVEWMRRQAPP